MIRRLIRPIVHRKLDALYRERQAILAAIKMAEDNHRKTSGLRRMLRSVMNDMLRWERWL